MRTYEIRKRYLSIFQHLLDASSGASKVGYDILIEPPHRDLGALGITRPTLCLTPCGYVDVCRPKGSHSCREAMRRFLAPERLRR